MNETVGFIGLGTMGMPMAANLAKAGVSLVVHDTSTAAVSTASTLGGVTAATSAADVAARAAVLFNPEVAPYAVEFLRRAEAAAPCETASVDPNHYWQF